MKYQYATVRIRNFFVTSALLATALIAALTLSAMAFGNQAYADEAPAATTHGTLSVTSNAAADNVITLGIGDSATVTISPYQHVQYKGCDKPDCPNGCAELVEDCFTVGKGCICMGPAPALRTATVSAQSDNPEIAAVSEAAAAGADLPASAEGDVGAMQDGAVTITGVAAGTTTVTIAATDLRDWQDASVTYTVVVEPVTLSENPVMLHNQFESGTADVSVTNASEAWASAITEVSVAPVVDGTVGEAVALTADQYKVSLGGRWGDYIEFTRTSEKPIFTVDEFDKDPVTVRTRWGGTMTYPQSKTYQVTVAAEGYPTASAQIAFYTGGSSTFSIIVDADGNDKTTDDQTIAKTWTADQIKAMATFAIGSSNCGMADFRTFYGEGVPLAALLADAGVEVSDTDYFLLDTTDKYGNEFTYDELFNTTRYFTQSIYDDDEVKALAAANAAITDEAEAAAAKLKMRQLLAAKAVEDNVTVEPRINVNYVESVLSSSDLATAVLPTAESATYDALIDQENQFRFMYGIELVQEEHTATFSTGEGSAVEPQVVKSHLMTSDQNTTMKSSYWANALVVYRGAGQAVEPSTAADAISKPADPTREGYSFDGWFTDKACTQAFDFEANDGALDADITLYAKWNPLDTTVVLSDSPVMLHNQFESGTADISLTNATEAWASAITEVSVAPVVDGTVGEAVKLSADQYDVSLGGKWGDYIEFTRTAAAPIFAVDEFDKDPVTVRTRWGGTMTYPQSKTYQVTVVADGYLTASAQIAFYTGGSSTFSIIVDADGNDKTTDDQTVMKTWTKDELEAMAGFGFANGSSQCGMSGFRTFSGNGISLAALLADAGVEVSATDYFLLDTTDKYGNEFTYDELFSTTRYFMQSIYDDAEMKARYAELVAADDQDAATVELRKLLAAKALQENSTVEPRISTDYVETVLGADEVAAAELPTAANTAFDALVAQENQFRFFYGLALVQDDCTVTFETGEGSAVAPQTVKSHLMTSKQNTTMKSSYWANSLVVYRGAGQAVEPSTAADAIAKPADPTREGYDFGGWFTDEACTQAFDFAANDGTVDMDTTLYAKWTEKSGTPDTPTPGPEPEPAPGTDDKPVAKAAKSITVNVKTVTAKAIAKAAKKAGATKTSLVKITLGPKVAKISKQAFKGYKKVKTIIVKTKKLKKKSVKDSLKGSKVKTVKVKIGAKKVNKKFVKKYKKFFTKKIAGKKANVK